MKQSVISSKRTLIFVLAFLVTIGMSALLFADNSYAASKSKALKAGVSFTGISQQKLWDGSLSPEQVNIETIANMYSFGVVSKAKTKFTTKMKVSATLYIPKKVMNKSGCEFDIVPVIACNDFYVQGKYVVILNNRSGKVNVTMYDGNRKPVKAKKYTKVKKTKKFYKVKIKNLPMDSFGRLPGSGEKTSIPAKTKYKPNFTFSISGFGKNSCGFMYIDDIQLKATKTIKIDFSKKNYKSPFGFRTTSAKQQVPVEIAKIK